MIAHGPENVFYCGWGNLRRGGAVPPGADLYMDWPVMIGGWSVPMWVSWIGLVVAGGLGRRRPSFSIAHQAGARHLPEKRCKSSATSRSTMRAPSRIWRKRVWRQSQLRSSATTIIPARCKSEFCQMTFEEALAQTMSIAGLLDVGGCRILDTDGFQALLGNAQRQRPIVIIAPRGAACPRPCVVLRL